MESLLFNNVAQCSATIVKNERVDISGQSFDRFEMEKRLKGKGV